MQNIILHVFFIYKLYIKNVIIIHLKIRRIFKIAQQINDTKPKIANLPDQLIAIVSNTKINIVNNKTDPNNKVNPYFL